MVGAPETTLRCDGVHPKADQCGLGLAMVGYRGVTCERMKLTLPCILLHDSLCGTKDVTVHSEVVCVRQTYRLAQCCLKMDVVRVLKCRRDCDQLHGHENNMRLCNECTTG